MNQTQYVPSAKQEDTTEHIMIFQEGNNMYNLLDENEKDWQK